MKVDGVVNANVSFEDRAAVVTIRPGGVRGDDLTRAVHEAGFEAQVVEDGSNHPSGAARTNKEQP